MTERLKIICSRLPRCGVFADVGCDHGLCTQYMLQNGLCERAYISDVSAPSLQKAETLLGDYIARGKCVPVCADGLSGIKEPCGCVLIAGMGGEEIVKILSRAALPERFVLQPMKNAEKVRAFLIDCGCRIEYDGTFYAEGKCYDLICGEIEGDEKYTEYELQFGRDNLKAPSEGFVKKVFAERNRLRAAMRRDMKERSREEIAERLRRLEVIADVFEDNL